MQRQSEKEELEVYNSLFFSASKYERDKSTSNKINKNFERRRWRKRQVLSDDVDYSNDINNKDEYEKNVFLQIIK